MKESVNIRSDVQIRFSEDGRYLVLHTSSMTHSIVVPLPKHILGMSKRTGDVIEQNKGQSVVLSLPEAKTDDEGGANPGTSLTHSEITALTVATSGSIQVQLSPEEASVNIQLVQLP